MARRAPARRATASRSSRSAQIRNADLLSASPVTELTNPSALSPQPSPKSQPWAYQLNLVTICPLRGGPNTVPVLIRPNPDIGTPALLTVCVCCGFAASGLFN